MKKEIKIKGLMIVAIITFVATVFQSCVPIPGGVSTPKVRLGTYQSNEESIITIETAYLNPIEGQKVTNFENVSLAHQIILSEDGNFTLLADTLHILIDSAVYSMGRWNIYYSNTPIAHNKVTVASGTYTSDLNSNIVTGGLTISFMNNNNKLFALDYSLTYLTTPIGSLKGVCPLLSNPTQSRTFYQQ